MAKFESVWINVETGDGHEYLLSIGWGSPVQKVETREHPDLQGPKSCMCVCVGQCRFIPKKRRKWLRLGLFWFNVETGDGHKYLLSIG